MREDDRRFGYVERITHRPGGHVREIDEHSELVVIWGGNPVNTQVNVMTHAVRARKERGAKIAGWQLEQSSHSVCCLCG